MRKISKKSIFSLVFIAFLICVSYKAYGFADNLEIGKAVEVTGQVTKGEKVIKSGVLVYGSLFDSLKTGNDSSLELILPPQVEYGNKYSGLIVLESNTEIIPNVYSTDSIDKEWCKGQNLEVVKDKTIIYIIDVNKGKIYTKMTVNCMKYIDIFQYVCGDYDGLKNPREGLIIDPSDVEDVEFIIESEEGKIIVTVKKGEVRIFSNINNDTNRIDKTITAGQKVEFEI